MMPSEFIAVFSLGAYNSIHNTVLLTTGMQLKGESACLAHRRPRVQSNTIDHNNTLFRLSPSSYIETEHLYKPRLAVIQKGCLLPKKEIPLCPT